MDEYLIVVTLKLLSTFQTDWLEVIYGSGKTIVRESNTHPVRYEMVKTFKPV